MKKVISVSIFLLSISILYAQYPPAPILGTGESYSKLFSVSYDYQTNGSVRYIVQDPANPQGLCVILMAQHDSTTPAGSGRYVFSSYTTNLGANWDTVVVASNANYGFPQMDVRNGVPVIALHNFTVSSYIYQDIIWGGLAWGDIPGLPTSPNPIVWPHITVTSNNNAVVWAAPNIMGSYIGAYTTYNGSSWTAQTSAANTGGPSGNFALASGTGGVSSMFGINYSLNPGGNDHMVWYKSVNNGISFTQDNALPPYIIDGTDTLFNYIECGRSAVYSGSEVHFTFGVYGSQSSNIGTNQNAYIKTRMYHWSSTSGLHLIAGSTNIPTLTDTITHFLVTPLCQPSIGRMQNGWLVCTYTAFLRGNTQTVNDGSVVNTGEIYYSYSSNNGVTWSTPSNITNTSGIEEKHSSVLKQQANTDNRLLVYYLRDMKAGGWVNIPSWGIAPVYGILWRSPNPIGINNLSEVASKFELNQNYPNPFNPVTKIHFSIPKGTVNDLVAQMKIYDAAGREVTTLVNEQMKPGSYEVDWDGGNFASGVYYYKLIAGDYSDTKKMILIK